MSNDRLYRLALELMQLGVSGKGVDQLFRFHDFDEIERQLAYLPYRNAKRPEAFIIEAIRKRYSAPKEFFYAANQTKPGEGGPVDQDPESPPGHPVALSQGHGVEDAPDPSQGDHGVEPGGTESDLVIPDTSEAIRPPQ